MGKRTSFQRLSALYHRNSCSPVTIAPDTRMVFMSDSHRGNGGRGDDFAHNRLIFLHSLAWYRNQGFTYVEVGDGEELWENGGFDSIHWAYSDIYIRMGYLHSENRLIFLWGNHNNIWRKPENVRKHLMPALCFYYDGRPSPMLEDMDTETIRAVLRGDLPAPQSKPVLRQLEVEEAIVLHHPASDLEILVTHGHQGEFWSDRFWRLSRFLVRGVWRFLQNAGARPRITPAGNYSLMREVKTRLASWSRKSGVGLITGHTHQPEFPSPGDEPCFNCGSSVHPRCITAIEIENESISLVKWQVSTHLSSGFGTSSDLVMAREILEGPVLLSEYAASGKIQSAGGKRKMERVSRRPSPGRTGTQQEQQLQQVR